MRANQATEVEAVAGGVAPSAGLAEGEAGEAAEAAAFSGPQGANTKKRDMLRCVCAVFVFFFYYLFL
jgi:hypothetical protein